MAEKRKKLAELAELVKGEVMGDAEVVIHGVNDLAEAETGEITFIADAKRVEVLAHTRASAVIIPQALEGCEKPAIRVRDPYLAVAVIHNFFLAEPFAATGVSPAAVIGEHCHIPSEVSIGPKAVLGARVSLGKRVTVCPGVVLGDDVTVGDDVLLQANVAVGAGCRIGSRVIIHSGSVIGSDGFGYATENTGRHVKRPHVGTVRIDDDVEIGANVCIDRGTFGKTWIQRGVKIDNLVQLGHNVVIGEDSLLVAQVGIAGSTKTGKNVVMGGQVGIGGHLSLGDRVMVAAKSGVHNNQADGSIIAGIPAVPHKTWLRASSAYAKLPDMVKEFREMKKKLAEIYGRIFPDEE